jgi:polyisoprenoid-binding protein YceI
MKQHHRTLVRIALALLAVAACARLNAQETVIELDPSQTRVEFTLGDILHTVHGAFRLKRGVIRFDPATGKAGGELIVDATSGNSGNRSRDRRMHKNILESARYPEISFTPDHIMGSLIGPGPWHVQVHGIFKIHGAEHELVLPVEAQVGPGEFTAVTHFVVPYVKWGMKNPSTFLLRVDDKVGIDIHAAGRVLAAAASR